MSCVHVITVSTSQQFWCSSAVLSLPDVYVRDLNALLLYLVVSDLLWQLYSPRGLAFQSSRLHECLQSAETDYLRWSAILFCFTKCLVLPSCLILCQGQDAFMSCSWLFLHVYLCIHDIYRDFTETFILCLKLQSFHHSLLFLFHFGCAEHAPNFPMK